METITVTLNVTPTDTAADQQRSHFYLHMIEIYIQVVSWSV